MEEVDYDEDEPSALELLKRTEMALDEMLLDLQNDDKPAGNGDAKKQDTEKSGGAPSLNDDPSASDLEDLDYLDHPDHASYHSDEHGDDDNPAGTALPSENRHGEEKLRAELEAFAISPWRNYLYGGPNSGPMPSAPSTPIRSSSFTQLSTLIRTDSVLGDEDQGGGDDPVAMDLSDMFGESETTTKSAPDATNPTNTAGSPSPETEAHETSNGDVEGSGNMQSLYIDDEEMPPEFKYINPKVLCAQLWCALVSLGALALVVYLLFEIDDSTTQDPITRLGSPNLPDIGCDHFMMLGTPESTLSPFSAEDGMSESPVDWTVAPSSAKHSSRKHERRRRQRQRHLRKLAVNPQRQAQPTQDKQQQQQQR